MSKNIEITAKVAGAVVFYEYVITDDWDCSILDAELDQHIISPLCYALRNEFIEDQNKALYGPEQ